MNVLQMKEHRYTPLKNYVDEINKALLQCDLRPDFDLKKLTRLFRNSLLDIVVDSHVMLSRLSR